MHGNVTEFLNAANVNHAYKHVCALCCVRCECVASALRCWLQYSTVQYSSTPQLHFINENSAYNCNALDVTLGAQRSGRTTAVLGKSSDVIGAVAERYTHHRLRL